VNGDYYLYATESNWGDGTGRHYMPIFKSKDLVHWTHVGDVFNERLSSWGKTKLLWAPDISKVGNTYYLYYAAPQRNASPCIGLATSDNPEGPWQDAGQPVFCSDDVGVPNSIDPWYDPKTRTMVWGSHNGIYALKLNEDGTGPAEDAQKVLLADNRFEAPYIFKHNDYYYLFVSAGSCCNGLNSTYRVLVGRSDSLTGPYVDPKGRDLRNDGGKLILSKNRVFVGPGHNAVAIDDAGHDWIVYHAISRNVPQNGGTIRAGMIDRIKWKDGWPVVNGGNGPSFTSQPAPVIDDN
jgi:arabinan endo-1,5-alpha-L-arabinosidase